MKQNNKTITLLAAAKILQKYSLRLGPYIEWGDRHAGFVEKMGISYTYEHDVYTYIQKVRYNGKGQIPER
jgi:hypothetical protein